jgi:hypothetical protein
MWEDKRFDLPKTLGHRKMKNGSPTPWAGTWRDMEYKRIAPAEVVADPSKGEIWIYANKINGTEDFTLKWANNKQHYWLRGEETRFIISIRD